MFVWLGSHTWQVGQFPVIMVVVVPPWIGTPALTTAGPVAHWYAKNVKKMKRKCNEEMVLFQCVATYFAEP